MVNPDVTHDVTFMINKSSPAFGSLLKEFNRILSPASMQQSLFGIFNNNECSGKIKLEKPVV